MGIGYSHFANLAGQPSSACSKRSLALSSFFPPCGGRESGKGDDAVQTRLCSVCESVLAHVSLGELGEVCVPDVINMGPLEQRHSVLICLHKHVPFKNFTLQLAREQHWTNSLTVSTCSTS